jgi:hypothetical protein
MEREAISSRTHVELNNTPKEVEMHHMTDEQFKIAHAVISVNKVS